MGIPRRDRGGKLADSWTAALQCCTAQHTCHGTWRLFLHLSSFPVLDLEDEFRAATAAHQESCRESRGHGVREGTSALDCRPMMARTSPQHARGGGPRLAKKGNITKGGWPLGGPASAKDGGWGRFPR